MEGNTKIFNFEYITIIYNLIEAYIAVIFGFMANSIGLIGFGVQSIAETVYGISLIVKYNSVKAVSKEAAARQTGRFRRFAVFTFFVSGLLLLFEGLRRLMMADIPKTSLAGIIIALVSLLATPLLTIAKYRTDEKKDRNQRRTLGEDLKGTFFYMLIPLFLLSGLLLNYYFHFWQIDPIVAGLIAICLLKKGYETNADVNS